MAHYSDTCLSCEYRLILQSVCTAYSDRPRLKDRKTVMPFPAEKEVLFPTVPVPAIGIIHLSFKRIPATLSLGLRLSERATKNSLPSIRLETRVVPPVPLTYTSFGSHSLIKHRCAMLHSVNCQVLTAKSRVLYRSSPCGIRVGEVELGQVLLRVIWFPPSYLIPPVSLIRTRSWTPHFYVKGSQPMCHEARSRKIILENKMCELTIV